MWDVDEPKNRDVWKIPPCISAVAASLKHPAGASDMAHGTG